MYLEIRRADEWLLRDSYKTIPITDTSGILKFREQSRIFSNCFFLSENRWLSCFLLFYKILKSIKILHYFSYQHIGILPISGVKSDYFQNWSTLSGKSRLFCSFFLQDLKGRMLFQCFSINISVFF